MKIYFTGSSLSKKNNKGLYEKIVDYLEEKGNEVFYEILSKYLPDSRDVSSHQLKEWHKEWSSYIKECDCAIVEASYPSTVHIGFEIGFLASKGKPIVVLYRLGKDPVFISHYYSSRLIKSEYTLRTVTEVLDWCLEEVERSLDRRFTMYISSDIDAYLDKVALRGETSRSEFIRRLIEKEMVKDSQ